MVEKSKKGSLPFPPKIRARLNALKESGDNRTDMEVLAGSIGLLEACNDPNTTITVRRSLGSKPRTLLEE